MKAILVTDMPKQCDDCDFCHNGRWLRYLCGLTGEEFEFINGKIKDFCPLRPLPHRYVEDKVKIETPRDAEVCTHGIQIGRNMVVNEILGETE